MKNCTKHTAALLLFLLIMIPAFHSKAAIYRDLNEGYSINIPSDWHRQTVIKNGITTTMFTSPDRKIVIGITTVIPKPYATIESIARDFELTFPHITPISPLRVTTINGVKGRSAKYLLREGAEVKKMSAFYVIENRRGYIVTATTAQNDYDNNLWRINNITSTLTFENAFEVQRYRERMKHPVHTYHAFHFTDALLTDSIDRDGQVSGTEIFSPGQTIRLVLFFRGGHPNEQLMVVWKNESLGIDLKKQFVTIEPDVRSQIIPLEPPDNAMAEGRYALMLYKNGNFLKRLAYSIIDRGAYYNYRATLPKYPRYVLNPGESLDLSGGTISENGAGDRNVVIYKRCNPLPVLEGNFTVTDKTAFDDAASYVNMEKASYGAKEVPLHHVCLVPLPDGSVRQFMITGQNYDTRTCEQSLVIMVGKRLYVRRYAKR